MRQVGETEWTRKAGGMLGVALATLMLSTGSIAHAGATAAGTLVKNMASATFEIDGELTTIPSNVVSTRIDELLDLALAPKFGGVFQVPTHPQPSFGVPFTLTNRGNGNEAFYITATVPGQAVSPSVAIDVDGNGAYDSAVDIILPLDGKTPMIASGATINLLIRFGVAPTQNGMLDVTASAATGHGAPATIEPGKGDGNSDAIVGETTASATSSVAFSLIDDGYAGEAATLTKSQMVLAPDGSNAAVTGATITYQLALATTGTETLADAEIIDAIPAGTAFVPGSINIDGVAASDAQDNDAAKFDGTAIRVALGDVSQPTTHVVTFQVKIQ